MSTYVRKVPVHFPRPRWAGKDQSRKQEDHLKRQSSQVGLSPKSSAHEQADCLRLLGAELVWVYPTLSHSSCPPFLFLQAQKPTPVFLLRARERGSWEGSEQEDKVEPKCPLACVTGCVWPNSIASGVPRPKNQLLFVKRSQAELLPYAGYS